MTWSGCFLKIQVADLFRIRKVQVLNRKKVFILKMGKCIFWQNFVIYITLSEWFGMLNLCLQSTRQYGLLILVEYILVLPICDGSTAIYLQTSSGTLRCQYLYNPIRIRHGFSISRNHYFEFCCCPPITLVGKSLVCRIGQEQNRFWGCLSVSRANSASN